MILQRRRTIWLGLALSLAALIHGGTNVARGAGLSSYVSPDFCAAMVIHPERISKSTLAEALKSGLPKSMASANSSAAATAALGQAKNLPTGMDAAKLAKLLEGKTIVRIVALIAPPASPHAQPAFGIIVQFGEEIDGEAILSAITSEWQPAETGGIKYKKMKNPQAGQPDIAAYAPDARTLIGGMDGAVVKMLAKNEGPRPILKQLQHSSFDNDVLIEFVGGSVAGAAAPEELKDVKSLSVKLNFSGTTLLHAEVVTDTDDTATMFAAAARKAVNGVKPQFEAMKKQPPPLVPAPAVPVLSKLGDEVFDGLSIKNEGPMLVVDLPMPASLPDALKLAAQLVAPLAAQMAPAGPVPPKPL